MMSCLDFQSLVLTKGWHIVLIVEPDDWCSVSLSTQVFLRFYCILANHNKSSDRIKVWYYILTIMCKRYKEVSKIHHMYLLTITCNRINELTCSVCNTHNQTLNKATHKNGRGNKQRKPCPNRRKTLRELEQQAESITYTTPTPLTKIQTLQPPTLPPLPPKNDWNITWQPHIVHHTNANTTAASGPRKCTGTQQHTRSEEETNNSRASKHPRHTTSTRMQDAPSLNNSSHTRPTTGCPPELHPTPEEGHAAIWNATIQQAWLPFPANITDQRSPDVTLSPSVCLT